MKKVNLILAFLALVVVMMTGVTACSSEASAGNANSKYMCPMDCPGSQLEEPGTCPVCGMDLVLREGASGDHDDHGHNHGGATDADHGHDHGDAGHEHEHSHEGADHGDHSHGDDGHGHSH